MYRGQRPLGWCSVLGMGVLVIDVSSFGARGALFTYMVTTFTAECLFEASEAVNASAGRQQGAPTAATRCSTRLGRLCYFGFVELWATASARFWLYRSWGSTVCRTFVTKRGIGILL